MGHHTCKISCLTFFSILLGVGAFLLEFYSILESDLLTDGRLNSIGTQIRVRCGMNVSCIVKRLNPNSFVANKFISSEDGTLFLPN